MKFQQFFCLLTVKRDSCPREGEMKLKIVDLNKNL